jgi:hypothetical protein
MESVEQATKALDGLASTYGIQGHYYDESAASVMNEFDALKWVTLCSQRAALKQREDETVLKKWKFLEVPPRFLGIYETTYLCEPVSLENTDESLSELAA